MPKKSDRAPATAAGSQAVTTDRPWRTKRGGMTKKARQELYQVYDYLGKETRFKTGLMLRIPVFIKDPAVAADQPVLGIQENQVRLDMDFGDGPTSSRIAVVDFNADTQQLTKPVVWDEEEGWFREPEGALLPDPPPDASNEKDPARYRPAYEEFIAKTLKNPYFHQLNVWAVVQSVLEFYQEPQALGRPVPWGFDGNRLIVVPHAGYGENAFYDRGSKSLQFYYFGDMEHPSYTCLSHDIITHETGHAVLDGIRPLYNQVSSVQTGAFHEFIGDLTAIMLALFNSDLRRFVARETEAAGEKPDILSDLAREFGEEVEGRPYLRTASNQFTMDDMRQSLSPHNVSQVLTGAMFDILISIAKTHMARNARPPAAEGAPASPTSTVTPEKAWLWAAQRLRQVALQALDLCPPCDIQFVDYARAVLRNDVLTNPVDPKRYRDAILEVFHTRKLCRCAYVKGKDLPPDCLLADAFTMPDLEFVYHDIERLSRSRTAAYAFLSDNRTVLRIPPHQDVTVVDLYDTLKMDVASDRLPREVVLEYLWREELALNNDPDKSLDFGPYAGKSMNLECGGTLVFDDRGNLLSWFHKPGTQHITPEQAAAIRKKTRPTKAEQAELADLDEGQRRKAAFLEYIATAIKQGLLGAAQLGNPFMDGLKPIAVTEENGVLRLEMTPHLRQSDLDAEVGGWTVDC